MNLNAITITLRPRTMWQAIDMGTLLARKWFFRLNLIWWLSCLPFTILLLPLSLLMPGKAMTWYLFFFWLLKPLYELPILHFISRSIFGEQLSIRACLSLSRKSLSIKQIFHLLLCRLSPFRSFTVPVPILEGLTGKIRRKRISLLRDGAETAVYLTFACSAVENILSFSFMGILFWIIPEELRWMEAKEFFFQPDSLIYLFCYVICCSVLAPVYCCAGFLMYISRRVQLEGWDIEIGFKRLQKRLLDRKNGVIQSAVLAVTFFCLSCMVTYSPAIASMDKKGQAKENIEQVLLSDDFGTTEKVERWVAKEKEVKELDPSWKKFFERIAKLIETTLETIHPVIAKSGEFLLWCMMGFLIAFLLIRYSRIRQWVGGKLGMPGKSYKAPEVMFGMDLRPESLPDDLSEACFALLESGKYRKGLGLLYRGTLSELIHTHHVQIHSSLTENECCEEVKNQRTDKESRFFTSLTSLWVLTAYGHIEPELEACRQIVAQWQDIYGVKS